MPDAQVLCLIHGEIGHHCREMEATLPYTSGRNWGFYERRISEMVKELLNKFL
ncbi:hypothetical protein [Thermococcus sp. LS2]|uniref:hypothetical protein n=1 Tax=Thermococcus sp. LS2 TaxID=1638260 RepID=UPI00143AB005|nr:hypothetical protein [Thermococcus sp. LS2]